MSDQERKLIEKYSVPAFQDALQHRDDRYYLDNLERALISALARVLALRSSGDACCVVQNLKQIKDQLQASAMREAKWVMHQNERIEICKEIQELVQNDDIHKLGKFLEENIESAMDCGGSALGGEHQK